MRRLSATWILTAAILLTFAHQMRVAASHGARGLNIIAATTSELVLLESGAAYGGMNAREDGWRLITAIFLHAGILHLVVNLIALTSIGELLEGLFGAPVMLFSFAFGGIAASVASLVLPDTKGMLYVGASGAIFSIAGTLVVGLRRIWRSERARWSYRLSSRLTGCLAFNLALGVFISAIAVWAGLSFVIANTAHVAGLLAGALVGLFPLHIRDNDVTRRIMRMFDPPPPQPPPPPVPFD